MEKEFPQYRKLANEKAYYRIDSLSGMTELTKLGSRWQKHELVARILPERNLIMDLLDGLDGTYLPVSSSEFDAIAATLTK